MSTTRKTKEYINRHLTVKDCLKRGLINYSALARQISKNLGKEGNFDAVLVASRRYANQLVLKDQEKDVLALLKKSRTKVRTGLCRFVLEPHTHLSDHIIPIHFIKSNLGITIITDDEDYDELRKIYGHNILDSRRGLAEISIITGKQADETVGLTNYLSGILASKDVNILTVIGSHKDDVFIIEQKDLSKVLDLLDFRLCFG